MTKARGVLAATIVGTMLAVGCANLTSIDRSTRLPGASAESKGKAIHLDAKQRLAFSKGFGIVCAEPSPDALSAVAASLGAGVAVPGYGSGSLAQALTESAASIGLRTQSITLMRDALYRICEAYYNKALNGPQVMSLIARTQDLTAAVLAIEQLTGAVAARQVALTGAAQAAASSNLASVGDLLDALRKKEGEKTRAADEAKAKRDEAKKAADEKATALGAARRETPPDPAKVQRLEDEARKANDDLALKQRALESAEAAAATAREDRQAVEQNHSAALTQANAAAQGSAAFAEAVGAVRLSEQSVAHIAAAVKEIVGTVVNRVYMDDGCFALISDNPPQDAKERDLYVRKMEFCQALINSMFARTGDSKGVRIQQIEKQVPPAK